MTTWKSAPGTCTRLVGKAGEPCQTCGRLIVRTDSATGYPEDYSLSHEGMRERLHQLNEERRPKR